MPILKELVEPLIPEAMAFLTDGGQYEATLRQLWYRVKEQFAKRHKGVPFYVYGSFTQDLVPAYEKVNGPIPGLLRGMRGLLAVRNDLGSVQEPVTGGMEITLGVGNKLVAVEKQDLYQLLRSVGFAEKFDCNILWLSGFRTEQAARVLLEARERGHEVLVIHDYDINGLLIHRSLTTASKRRDIAVPGVIDLGFTWKDVQELGLTPEPYDKPLSKQDRTKLDGLAKRGEISKAEYAFLKQGRVELQQLSSAQILAYLERKFKELGLEKVLPDQAELKEKEKEILEENLFTWPQEQGLELSTEAMEAIGLGGVLRAVAEVQGTFSGIIRREAQVLMEKELPDQTAITVGELKKRLKLREKSFWTWVAADMAQDRVPDVKEALVERVGEEKGEWLKVAQAAEDVLESVGKLRTVLEEFST